MAYAYNSQDIVCFGSPMGNRTPVLAVRGPRPNL